MDWIVSGWRSYGLRYRRYRDRAVHDTADRNTIVVEQEVIGTNSADVEFVLPNVIVLSVQNGQIAELRDYADLRAAAAAIGRDIA